MSFHFDRHIYVTLMLPVLGCFIYFSSHICVILIIALCFCTVVLYSGISVSRPIRVEISNSSAYTPAFLSVIFQVSRCIVQ